jgi:transcriptional regulator with XRE-family HTH domain
MPPARATVCATHDDQPSWRWTSRTCGTGFGHAFSPERVNKLTYMRRPWSAQLGEIIRRQRELNQLTLRQFAAMAGISNPYLSQIERGLRTPSATVVDAIASSLKINADVLYEQAGLPVGDDDGDDARARVEAALEADPALAPRQRRALMEIYDTMVMAGPVPRPRRRI